MLHVNSTAPKSEILVMDVLRLKHPDLQEVELDHPDFSAFEAYLSRPKVLPLDITVRKIEETMMKMGGSGGPSGAYSKMLKDWCKRFSAESKALREELAAWTLWLANGSPPWEGYCALIAEQPVALDKSPVVRTVGIGEAIRRLMAKLVQSITSHQAM